MAADGGARVVARSGMLAAICATRRCLAVAGTKGKTTTASMLSLILIEAGLRPSFLIGADVNEVGTNAVWDSGEWLVVEADESFGTFQGIAAGLGRSDQCRAPTTWTITGRFPAYAPPSTHSSATPRQVLSCRPTTTKPWPSATRTGR